MRGRPPRSLRARRYHPVGTGRPGSPRLRVEGWTWTPCSIARHVARVARLSSSLDVSSGGRRPRCCSVFCIWLRSGMSASHRASCSLARPRVHGPGVEGATRRVPPTRASLCRRALDGPSTFPAPDRPSPGPTPRSLPRAPARPSARTGVALHRLRPRRAGTPRRSGADLTPTVEVCEDGAWTTSAVVAEWMCSSAWSSCRLSGSQPATQRHGFAAAPVSGTIGNPTSERP